MTKTQARVLLPNRGQMELRASGLESLLPEGHRVRLVWAYVERQDLKGFYEDNRAVEGGVGRSAIAPEILLGLWLYATLDGVGSAREIARLTEAHDAYRWLCGGAQVNDHTLSDFRTDHGEALDELLSVSIASLMAAEWSSSSRWRRTACGCGPVPGRDRFGARRNWKATRRRRGRKWRV